MTAIACASCAIRGQRICLHIDLDTDREFFSCGSCGYTFTKSEGVTIQEGTHLEFVCTPCYEGEERK